MNEKINITFYGGAGSVTGANFLIDDGSSKIVVDCGITQGEEWCDDCNFDEFAYAPQEVDALIITHAHLDHIGRAPKLVRDGFKGPVYMTKPTKDLGEVMLPDSERILAREAERRGIEKMYDTNDIDEFFAHVHTHDFHEPFEVGPYTVEFFIAGHVLGSAIVVLTHRETGKKIVFSGDLGNSPAPFLQSMEHIKDADYMIMESVYGDRTHEHKDEREEKFARIVRESAERGGTLMIPAFSIERTQIMLYLLSNLMENGDIPKLSVFLDSPLAIKVTAIYAQWSRLFKEEVQGEVSKEGNIFDFSFLTKTESVDESKAIDHEPDPKIVIAGAGMSHGGRIQHHELHNLEDPKNTLLIVGYQSPGSPGRLLLDGANKIRIFNKDVKVKATIEHITGFSAHADHDDLFAFAQASEKTLKKVFLAMGEPSAASFLAQRIHDFLGVTAIVPEKDATHTLE